LEKDPFDVPHAETEIVAGYETEYSGRRLAFLKLAKDVQIVLGAVIVVELFLSGPYGPVFLGLPAFWYTLWFILKVLFVVMITEYLTCIFARLRIDQVLVINWRMLQKYPEVKPKVPDGFRGRQIFDIDLCIGCGLCARDCPAKAIEMVDVEGKKKPLFHLDLCIFCYQCAESCPRNAIKTSGFFELASTNKHELVVKPQTKTPEEE